MKIRNGFVSNSSSSSFLIVGKAVKRAALKGLRAKAKAMGLNHVQDNAYYDPAEYCECRGEDENCKECESSYYTIYFGFGETGDEYGMNDVPLDRVNEYLANAEKLFGKGNVKLHYGRIGND